jgi:DNA-binding response OmpR family regulator
MSYKILVIEDDCDMLAFLSLILRQADFEVLQANSAQEGLKLGLTAKPDLVLLDIVLPDIDGWEVCRRLREIADMPIVFVTALGDVETQSKGLAVADDYFIKPVDPRELMNSVRSHIAGRQSKSL